MAKEKYLLKILSGPHQGAEVALDEGELIIGNAQDCDLILSDTLVSPHHLKTVVSENGVSIVPLESPVYYDGQEIAKDEYFPVEPFKFISLGTTHFIIGPVEGEWPALSAVDIPGLTKLEKAEDALFEEKEIETLEGEGGPPLDLEPIVEKTGLEKLLEDKKKLILVGAAIVLLIVLVIGGIFVGLRSSPKEVVKVDLMEPISKIISQVSYPQAFSVEEHGGVYFVKGWVNNDEERNKIEVDLKKLRSNINTEIRVQEYTLNNLKDLLKAMKAPVSVDSIEPGKMRLYGYYGDEAGWESVKSDIQKDIPGLKLLKDDVMTPSKLSPIITKVLNDHHVADKIQFIPQKEAVILKGMISQADVPMIREAIVQFISEAGPTIPIKNQVIIAKPEDLYLDLDMDSVIIGKQGFIITKSGQRLFEGGVLKGGYVIEKISREGIILKKGNQTITLNLGENYD